jgi:hypothetical protein
VGNPAELDAWPRGKHYRLGFAGDNLRAGEQHIGAFQRIGGVGRIGASTARAGLAGDRCRTDPHAKRLAQLAGAEILLPGQPPTIWRMGL